MISTVSVLTQNSPDYEQAGFRERLLRAVDYLSFRRRICNARNATETIRRILAEQEKIKLFKQYFPAEWQKSNRSLFKTGFYENYSERINEFFELVNKNLFPILSGWNEDPETEFERFNIFSSNVDFCCEDIEYEYLHVSFVMALLFFSNDEELWVFLEQYYRIQKSDFPGMLNEPHENLWEQDKTGRAEIYRNIFAVIDHSTGNPWLDNSNCHYQKDYLWDAETVEFLTRSHQKSEEIWDKISLLDRMIEADSKTVLLEMIELWNTGQLSEEPKKRRSIGKKEFG